MPYTTMMVWAGSQGSRPSALSSRHLKPACQPVPHLLGTCITRHAPERCHVQSGLGRALRRAVDQTAL